MDHSSAIGKFTSELGLELVQLHSEDSVKVLNSNNVKHIIVSAEDTRIAERLSEVVLETMYEDQFEQQPRRLQLPSPPAMQPDPNAANANANDNIVQIPRSMINVARRQQQLINADNRLKC